MSESVQAECWASSNGPLKNVFKGGILWDSEPREHQWGWGVEKRFKKQQKAEHTGFAECPDRRSEGEEELRMTPNMRTMFFPMSNAP